MTSTVLTGEFLYSKLNRVNWFFLLSIREVFLFCTGQTCDKKKPQDSSRLDPSQSIVGGLIYEDVYNNGGQWLMAGITVCFGSGSFCPYPDTDWTFFLPESGSESAKKNPVPIRKIWICEKTAKNCKCK